MPRHVVKDLSPEKLQELRSKYPEWVVGTALIWEKDRRRAIARNAKTWAEKFRKKNPDEWARRRSEYQYTRKLRESEILPKFVPGQRKPKKEEVDNDHVIL